jgi:hypothetical protein
VFATLNPYLEADIYLYHRDRPEQTDAYHAPSSVAFPCRNKEGDPRTIYGGTRTRVGGCSSIRRTRQPTASAMSR